MGLLWFGQFLQCSALVAPLLVNPSCILSPLFLFLLSGVLDPSSGISSPPFWLAHLHVLPFLDPPPSNHPILASVRRSQGAFERFRDFPLPFWLALFPEGTRYTEQKLKTAQEFARSQGLPVPKNTLVPRTKVRYATPLLVLRATHRHGFWLYLMGRVQ